MCIRDSYAGRRQNSLTDYALGNRSLPWWAILASIPVSYTHLFPPVFSTGY